MPRPTIMLLAPEPLKSVLVHICYGPMKLQAGREKKEKETNTKKTNYNISHHVRIKHTCWKSGMSSKALILNVWRNSERCSRACWALARMELRLEMTSNRELSKPFASEGIRVLPGSKRKNGIINTISTLTSASWAVTTSCLDFLLSWTSKPYFFIYFIKILCWSRCNCVWQSTLNYSSIVKI